MQFITNDLIGIPVRMTISSKLRSCKEVTRSSERTLTQAATAKSQKQSSTGPFCSIKGNTTLRTKYFNILIDRHKTDGYKSKFQDQPSWCGLVFLSTSQGSRQDLEHPVWLPHGALDVQASHLENKNHIML